MLKRGGVVLFGSAHLHVSIGINHAIVEDPAVVYDGIRTECFLAMGAPVDCSHCSSTHISCCGAPHEQITRAG